MAAIASLAVAGAERIWVMPCVLSSSRLAVESGVELFSEDSVDVLAASLDDVEETESGFCKGVPLATGESQPTARNAEVIKAKNMFLDVCIGSSERKMDLELRWRFHRHGRTCLEEPKSKQENRNLFDSQVPISTLSRLDFLAVVLVKGPAAFGSLARSASSNPNF